MSSSTTLNDIPGISSRYHAPSASSDATASSAPRIVVDEKLEKAADIYERYLAALMTEDYLDALAEEGAAGKATDASPTTFSWRRTRGTTSPAEEVKVELILHLGRCSECMTERKSVSGYFQIVGIVLIL